MLTAKQLQLINQYMIEYNKDRVDLKYSYETGIGVNVYISHNKELIDITDYENW